MYGSEKVKEPHHCSHWSASLHSGMADCCQTRYDNEIYGISATKWPYALHAPRGIAKTQE